MDQGQTIVKHWNKRYWYIHIWKILSATFYPLATVIYIIPHVKYTAPFPQDLQNFIPVQHQLIVQDLVL